MTYFADLTYDEMLSEIHAAYPNDRAEVLLADDEFVAGLTRGTLLDVEADFQIDVTVYAAAVLDEGGSLFDAAAHARRLYAALCGVLAATDAVADDYDADDNGDMLVDCPLWPVDGCGDLNALSATLHSDGAS